MSTQKNLITLCFATVFTLGLAACGGGGGGDAPVTGMMDGDGDADPMVGDGDADPMVGDGDAKTPAETLAAAQTEYDELTAESTDEDRAAAVAALEGALMLAGNEAAYVAYLEKKVAGQEAAAAATAAAAAAEEASDMAKAVLAAIKDNTTGEDGAAVVQPDAPMVSLAASSAGVLTAEQEGYTMSAAPEEIAGWRGRLLENDGDTTVIYTNIEDAVAKEIGDTYGAASGPGEPEHYDVTADSDVAVGTATAYDIPWSKVKRADDMSATTGAGTEDVMTTFAGSVRGVAGTFSCAGMTCNPPVPDPTTGAFTSGEEWTFTPTDPNGTFDDADTAYVSFGWWLNAMGDTGKYEFDAFTSVEGMVARGVAAAEVEGSATYKGGAAGKWAMQSTSDDSATGGHFTANATLTANFAANTLPAGEAPNTDGVSISGSITDFMTGDVSRPNWKVKLTGPAMVPETIDDTGVAGTTSWTTGGAVPGEGTWNAIFYGGMPNEQPAAAAGEFNAAIPSTGEIARISGAFGATKVAD